MVNCHLQALKVGLLLVWLCGFVLIGISFYATTQMLPFSSMEEDVKKVGGGSEGPSSFGNGSRVSVEPDIDFTFLGTPFFHSMVARAQASDSDISVLMDSETILLPDFISTLSYVHRLDHDWLLIASPKNISEFPFQLDVDGKHWLGDNGKTIKMNKDFLSRGSLEHCDDNKMIMAWNNGDLPLHNGVLPPFLYGKGFHNFWVINEALSSDFRFVFDASWTISSFFIDNLDDGNTIESRNWENVGNSHLGSLYGSLFFREASFSNIIKLFKCGGQYHFGSTKENIVYPLRSPKGLSFDDLGVFVFRKDKKLLSCFDEMKSLRGNVACSRKKLLTSLEPLALPYSLELLLSKRADQNKTIVLGVADIVSLFTQSLDIWIPYYVVFLNLGRKEMEYKEKKGRKYKTNFQFLNRRKETKDGLPVFRDRLAPSNISYNDCHFGTNCFQRGGFANTELGYNLLMSDVDVYWFKNPLPLLTTFGSAVFVAQSDEYKITGPINLPRRLNSGFYYAHSDSSTLAALDKVVKHASLSNLSEQPSFYDTLCGFNGSYRVDDDTCLEPETNLTVRFLDRDLFPNGAYRDLWDSVTCR
ncbi:hypothetical protein OSB04_018515 [Centaurea solstitialis]|uniref:Nucleotide-diphospho-sugar transferase domain-containing protein n=1 Tax=Centaurea solstitialis TaxID=347529 RepID=A0AA38TGV4_9ASTR|nr:hypothetical protein OSB04_018515 [Centaurea solstitialis]